LFAEVCALATLAASTAATSTRLANETHRAMDFAVTCILL
jgi:hypothetical protein